MRSHHEIVSLLARNPTHLLDAGAGLDPHARTTVTYVYLDLGDFQRVIDSCEPRDRTGAVQALIALGRKQEAIAYCLELEKTI
jgi:hypothetical protein